MSKPVLRWASFPDAARYAVTLYSATGDVLLWLSTTNTSMEVAPPLPAGGRYEWAVHAFNAANTQIAYWSPWYFYFQAEA